eukprot:CAMPEP_0119378494 /NCGR_PEP_ID=MMETSP1334-20130426/48531_1 /TAXON_ID=127549 /ORGANISM="Calcidiscus leptoporus, Strain RCC1130" /LENGTH=64 /DNA_ID=CAMNT_0007397713 /DNA_START=96 /DNA_END=286 /DNA_ORIENTATION=-
MSILAVAGRLSGVTDQSKDHGSLIGQPLVLPPGARGACTGAPRRPPIALINGQGVRHGEVRARG